MTPAQSRYIERESSKILSEAFTSLIQPGETVLVEVACSPESRLSKEIQDQMGYEAAAVRCSHWNGCDLSTDSGVRLTLDIIQSKKPRHVWISTECGPYSPTQAINQRSAQQVADLETKRKAALRQYIGGSCLVHYCIQMGIHVTWEWAEKCQGWRLPFMQRIQKKYEPYMCVTHGCQVNLRDPVSQQLLHKGWKLMTTHQRLRDLMQLPCRCPKGYKHGKCEGGLARLSAYYTPEYVKRVAVAMLHDMTHTMIQKELEGRSVLLERFGEGLLRSCKELRDHGSQLKCALCSEPHQKPWSKPQSHQKEGEGRDHSNHESKGRCGEHPQHDVLGEAMAHQQLHHEKDVEVIKKKLYLLHAATGHGSVRNMVNALQRRGANKQVLALAKDFKCSICDEKKLVTHKNASSLEPLPPKLATISADGGHWIHPHTGVHCEFAMIIDGGSRYRVSRVLKTGKHQTMKATEFLDYLREGWIQYFGKPTTLRLDPAGAFRSQEVERFCDEHNIFLDVIPGEAHWQLGVCEQAIQGVKEIMSKLAEQNPEITPQEALSEGIRVFNNREMVRGFSPVQHLLGQSPDETGRFVSSLTGQAYEKLIENPTVGIQESIERMKQAEQALSEWQAHQRVTRALNSRPQKMQDYRPGDLVYFWRKQIKNQGQKLGKHGAFLGPARILAVETHKDTQGNRRPSKSVWCVRGRRLLKCSPEQLRPASHREELLNHLATEGEPSTPWTFPRVAEELGGNEYEDISKEVPTEMEWEQAQDPVETAPPTRRQRVQKRTAEPSGPSTSTGRKAKARSSASLAQETEDEPLAECWWNEITEEEFSQVEGHSFWCQQDAAVEIEIPMPESKRGVKTMLGNMESYFVGALKRRAIEVSEKRLSPEDLKRFQEAKDVEVRNFIAAKAFKALPKELQPSRDQAIGMRWILTWKLKDDGTSKPKARAILQGYQDPNYEYRSTTTPVMTRMTRQTLLQWSALRRWKVKKGDVSGAFLQGRPYPDTLYCIPCPEITKAMGLSDGEICQVQTGCYGLVDAPLEWYRSIAETLEELGLVKSWSDPCCWLWKPNGKLRGMVAGHVDDFLFAGDSQDKEWRAIEEALQTKYKWSDWETGKFIQCGVTIEEQQDGSYALSQPSYIDGVSEINLNATRRRETNSPTTEHEKTALRAILGAVSWHAQQVAPHFSAEVGLLLSEVSESSVETILKANRLLGKAKARKDHKLIIHAYTPETQLGLFAWADAAGQNRRDGSSTQGIFIGAAPIGLLDGNVEHVTPIAWHAGKIDRVTRSPGAAEARAVVNGEDLLFHARYQFGELLEEQPNIFDVDTTVNRVLGCVISDSRNVFDKLQSAELSPKGAERRTDIELLCLKSAQRHNNLHVRWVHSEAQLSNALTKPDARELELYYKGNQQWRIVQDEAMRSFRKRKQAGVGIFENSSNTKHQDCRSPGHAGETT